MHWQKNLLALTLLLGASAVILPAHAETKSIWVKSTSGTDFEATEKLRNDLVNLHRVATETTINVEDLINLLYQKALKDQSLGYCLNDITELSDPVFASAFEAEWKKQKRSSYPLEASHIDWPVFLTIGSNYKGFVVCDDEFEARVVQIVKAQVSVQAQTKRATDLATAAMSPEQANEYADIMAALRKSEADIATISNSLKNHEDRISKLEKLELEKLEGTLKELTERIGKMEQTVGGLVIDMAAVKESTAANTEAIEKLAGVPARVDAIATATKDNADDINELNSRTKKVEDERWSQLMLIFAAVGVGLFGAFFALAIARLFSKSNREGKKKPDKMTRPVDDKSPGGKRTFDPTLDRPPPSDTNAK